MYRSSPIDPQIAESTEYFYTECLYRVRWRATSDRWIVQLCADVNGALFQQFEYFNTDQTNKVLKNI